MNRNQIRGVDHIAIQLADISASQHFFQEILGFRTLFEVAFADKRIMMLLAGKIKIELIEDPSSTASQPGDGKPGFHHLAIGVQNLEETMEEMHRRNIKVLAEIYEPAPGIREAIVNAPGGVRVQFVQRNMLRVIWNSLKRKL